MEPHGALMEPYGPLMETLWSPYGALWGSGEGPEGLRRARREPLLAGLGSLGLLDLPLAFRWNPRAL